MGYYDVELPKIPIILDNVRCSGNESSLVECPNEGFNIHNCVHFEDIVLDCRGTVHAHTIYIIYIIYILCICYTMAARSTGYSYTSGLAKLTTSVNRVDHKHTATV